VSHDRHFWIQFVYLDDCKNTIIQEIILLVWIKSVGKATC
jgi:hypothetical protein